MSKCFSRYFTIWQHVANMAQVWAWQLARSLPHAVHASHSLTYIHSLELAVSCFLLLYMFDATGLVTEYELRRCQRQFGCCRVHMQGESERERERQIKSAFVRAFVRV